MRSMIPLPLAAETNIAYISESLGHNSLQTTETYLASFEKEERQKNAALLTQFQKD